jgi:polyisoprenoid-binding protein YceI
MRTRFGCRIFAVWAGGFCVRRLLIFSLLLAACASVVRAQETVVKFDPAATTVNFTLGATLHSVHGTFKLKSGTINVDPATGKASGAIVVDATSGNSDEPSRDAKMNKDVLESAKFPEIVFSPTTISAVAGHGLKDSLEQKGRSQLRADGVFRLHGQDHDMTLDLVVENDGNGRLHISIAFPVPYVKWGLKSPNTFILRVGDSVDLQIDAVAQILSGR